MSDETEIAKWWRDLLKTSADHDAMIHHAFQTLENAKLLSKVTVHRYICRVPQCGVLATVIRIDGRTILRTRDYKFSPGMNADRSVEVARAKNTLDGKRHWPGHTFDVGRVDAPGMGIDMNCRHSTTTVATSDILSKVQGVAPGHPQAPTLL